MDLVVDPAPDGVKLPGTGYTSGSLQDNITIFNDKGLIGGHLKYTTGMVTMYPDDRLKQEGNFIALWLHEIGDPYVNYDKIEAKIVDGEEEKELEVSDEGYICFRVNDRATTKLVVTVTIDDQTYDAEYKLTGLTVDSYGWNILKGTNPTGEDLYQWAEERPASVINYPDIYSDDSTNKKWYRYLPSEYNILAEYGFTITNELISDRKGLDNEWIKSQLRVEYKNLGQSQGFDLVTSRIYLKPNTNYTFSLYQKGTDRIGITIQTYKIKDNTFSKNLLIVSTPYNLDETKFIRYSGTFRTDETISDDYVLIKLYVNAGSYVLNSDFTYVLAGMKLEEGDHATGWDDYYSGDNLLLDTDQPVISKVNDHVTNDNARSLLISSRLDPELNTASIQFIPDSDLPEKDLKINNKMVFQFNQTGNVEGGAGYCGITYDTRYMDTITDETFKDGDIVTLSFYAKINEKLSNEEPINNYVEFYKNNTEQKISISFYQTNSAVKITKCLNGWSRYVITSFVDKEVFNISNLFPVIRFYIGVTLPAGSRIQDYHMEFCGVKLEKGAHVTDYRPAPTDFNINYILESDQIKVGTTASVLYNLIADAKNIPANSKVTAQLDGTLSEEKTSFGIGIINPGQISSLIAGTKTDGSMGLPYAQDPKTGYFVFDNAIWWNGNDRKPFDNPTQVYINGNPLASSGEIRVNHVKLEVGRYPTKWVDGTGDPASADEEDDDSEVT